VGRLLLGPRDLATIPKERVFGAGARRYSFDVLPPETQPVGARVRLPLEGADDEAEQIYGRAPKRTYRRGGLGHACQARGNRVSRQVSGPAAISNGTGLVPQARASCSVEGPRMLVGFWIIVGLAALLIVIAHRMGPYGQH
jgi:hypothetical protein